ncbi:MAG TPA: polysaccharide biosynthesis tyrosine autokinase [Vicinamibacterales bacterium]|jgi:capsular exopolysaccharide synthesis family protein|nr:polysaccharide biosynthesis tyrosine autokinase [Vicinamibacterales bacterium]
MATPRSSSATSWHPTEYLRILYKRRWVAIPGFLVVFLTGAISSLRTTPLYEATTQIQIEQDARRATSIDSVLADRSSWYDDSFYPTQYRILQSRDLALRAVAELGRQNIVERTPPARLSLNPTQLVWMAVAGIKDLMAKPAVPAAAADADLPEGVPAGALAKAARLQGELTVVPVRTSSLVELQLRSPDAEFAARAVNIIADEYIKRSLEMRVDASKEASDWLSKTLGEQRKKVEASDLALQDFKEQNHVVSVDDKQNITNQKLTALNQQLIDARIARYDKEANYNQLLDLRAKGLPLDSFPAVMSADFVQKLKTELLSEEAKQDDLRKQGFGENYAPLKALTAQVADTKQRLNAEIDKVVESVRTEFEAAKEKEDAMSRALEAQKGESIGLDRKAMEYAALQREADGNRQLYETLLQRTKETGVSNEFRGTNIQVVDKAVIPTGPVLPNTPRDLVIAGAGGLALGLFLAFGFEYFDSRIKSPEEIKTHLGLPFLGMIPTVAGADAHPEAPMLVENAPPAFGEAIRAIRTSVLFSSTDEGARAVLVTSTGPHEGKTVVSSSLAITLAQAGLRTLVVDADLRRPRLHEAMSVPQEPGLSNVLVGELGAPEAVRQTSVEHLSVLAAGHIPPNPAELLGSPKYIALFEDLKRRFDWIVIDAPPVMPVTDAAIISRLASGVLFVIGAEMTPRQSALTAIEHLQSANAKFVGAVLNRVNVHRHAYYYSPYYRKDYAKYYQRSAKGA